MTPAHPTFNRLRAQKEAILRTWLARVREHVPAAARHDDRHVLDSIPLFMDDLAQVLKTCDPAAVTSSGLSREHARQRAELEGYTLDQNVREYRLLRKTIFEILEAEGPIDTKERDLLHEALDYAIGEAGGEFMRQHLSKSTEHIRELEQEKGLRELFVSTLSHDLRQPLAVARLNAQLSMRLSSGNPPSAAALEKVLSSVERVEKMIRHLLDANRIRAGQSLPLDIADADLSAIIYSVVEEFRIQHGSRVKFRDAAPVRGSWSADHLRRVAENLIENAVKYGDPVRDIEITLEQSPQRTSFRVHNWGPPIPAEEQERIFERFRRLTKADMRAKGWGLGLAFVRAAVEAHGGTVRVRSSVEEGTTFIVELPNASGASGVRHSR